MTLALFYGAALVAVVATLLAVSRRNAVHGLLYLVVSLLAVAVIFAILGAPFAAALQAVVYAGAIIVLFVFVVMLLGLTREPIREEAGLHRGAWVGPAALSAALGIELGLTFWTERAATGSVPIGPGQVSGVLLGPYLLAVEIASTLLLSALLGAYHLGRRDREVLP